MNTTDPPHVKIKIKNASRPLASYNDTLKSYMITKESKLIRTNTRIPDKTQSMSGGGSYHIPDEEYYGFLRGVYFDHIFNKKKSEHLTEKQLETGGAICIDIDMRFPASVKSRKYTTDHVSDLLCLYLDVIREAFQIDETTAFSVFVFEKSRVNCVEDGAKSVTKDGIHIIIGIQADRVTQMMIREHVMARIAEVWTDLDLQEDWNSVFDKGISEGCVNWQLYGSCKPHHEPYKLTQVYDVSVDKEDGQWMMPSVDPTTYETKENVVKLSVRYREHPNLFMTATFVQEYNTKKGGHDNRRKTNAVNSQKTSLNFGNFNTAVICVRSKEELDELVQQFLESLSVTEYDLMDAYRYTMILNEEYYGEGSFVKWIRVGWALRNIDNRLFIVWVAFSAKSKTFEYDGIRDLYDKWIKFDMNNLDGLTKRSIMHWAKQTSISEFNNVKNESLDNHIDLTLQRIAKNASSDRRSGGAGDVDLASILHHLYKDEFVCSSISNSTWHYYKIVLWEKNDRGTTLRNRISSEMRSIYMKKLEKLSAKMRCIIQAKDTNAATDSDENEEEKMLNAMITAINDIIKRLASTTDKNNIMTEAKELFYDSKFIDSLDTNPYLLCFTNGVFDFKEKVFRQSRPDDYLSICTNITYEPITQIHHEKVAEINDFMTKLMPDKDLCEYLWQHLASILIGVAKVQTFNMYTGDGQNGKSVLISLMEKVLGDYKRDAPLSIITQKRVGNGGVSPELAALRGCRYAVMAEPSKGDIINEGPMKQLTSGADPIQCRALYSEPISFVPQFKLVVCSNELMEVKSNDHGTWRRIRLLLFESLFTDKPVNDDPVKPHQFLIDRNIIEKFDEWKTVFMAMLIEIAVVKQGMVDDCDRVLEASNTYRQHQDYISAFISDKIVPTPNGLTQKRLLANTFTEWYRSYYPGDKIPKLQDMTAVISKRYRINTDGHWVGFSIRTEKMTSSGNSENSSINTDDELPDIDFVEE